MLGLPGGCHHALIFMWPDLAICPQHCGTEKGTRAPPFKSLQSFFSLGGGSSSGSGKANIVSSTQPSTVAKGSPALFVGVDKMRGCDFLVREIAGCEDRVTVEYCLSCVSLSKETYLVKTF